MEDQNIRNKIERINSWGSKTVDSICDMGNDFVITGNYLKAKAKAVATKTRELVANTKNFREKTAEYTGDFISNYSAGQLMSTLGPLSEEFTNELKNATVFHNRKNKERSSILSSVMGFSISAGEDTAIVMGTTMNICNMAAGYQVEPYTQAFFNTATGLAIAKTIGLATGFGYKYGRGSQKRIDAMSRVMPSQLETEADCLQTGEKH